MMIVFKEDEYVVVAAGHEVGRFKTYDEAIDQYLELFPGAIAF